MPPLCTHSLGYYLFASPALAGRDCVSALLTRVLRCRPCGFRESLGQLVAVAGVGLLELALVARGGRIRNLLALLGQLILLRGIDRGVVLDACLAAFLGSLPRSSVAAA